jgi:dipeptidyl aminopeptidase/acylaminoacyl peptidase
MHIRVARALLPVLLIVPLSAQKHPFNAQAMMQLARISDPQLSPDGRSVAFAVQTIDVASNTKPKQIYVVALDGGAPRKIADAAERPRWAPDSRKIAFVSDRGGSSQIWMMDADGANAKQITNLATEAAGVLYAHDGKSLVFTSEVYPECGADDACNKQKLDAEKDNKVKARIINALLYRHWTAWQGPRRSHLLVIPVSGGAAKDLTPGNRDVPPFSLGGPEDYAISPDGTEVCYAINADEVPAMSTNTDLYVVPIIGGPPKKITVNPAADN